MPLPTSYILNSFFNFTMNSMAGDGIASIAKKYANWLMHVSRALLH